jgi:hypothetical protein
MGHNAIYLMPFGSQLSAAEYAARAKTVLMKMKVISEPDEHGIFYNGERSTEPFQQEPGDDECGFELGQIFSGPHFTVAPDEYVDGVSCPRCEADMTGEWASAIEDGEGNRDKKDLREERVLCPKCGSGFRPDEVKGETVDRFYLTDRFVSFWDVRWPKKEWLADFDRRMECVHEVFEYGWT